MKSFLYHFVKIYISCYENIEFIKKYFILIRIKKIIN